MKKIIVFLISTIIAIGSADAQSTINEPTEDTSDDNKIYTGSFFVQKPPQFPGGENAMFEWIKSHLTYPAEATLDDFNGRIYVRFVIEKDGSISNARVVKSRHPAFDKEAVRVVTSMPKWDPGMNNRQPIRVEYILPINFKLTTQEKSDSIDYPIGR